MNERIYIGGLDPSRGLTVEIVASRLDAVPGVEILSINDVPTQRNDHHFGGRESHPSMRKVKVPYDLVDEDGDLVDTRNFFYLEARVAAATNASGTTESSSPTVPVSALGLLARQYNGVKWKGCNLRVEPARPHFLKRLDEERALLRDDYIIEDHKQDSTNKTHTEMEDGEEKEEKVVVTTIRNRRRLRIRKRFGEEAFHVDTYPHLIEISQNVVYIGAK